jgi:hypothetical protein
MPKPERSTTNSLVRTYITTSKTSSGATVYHVRIVSAPDKIDKRGSGRTVAEARADALSKP